MILIIVIALITAKEVIVIGKLTLDAERSFEFKYNLYLIFFLEGEVLLICILSDRRV